MDHIFVMLTWYEDALREVGLVGGIWKFLGLQAEGRIFMSERRRQVKLDARLVGGEFHDATRSVIVTADVGLLRRRIENKGVIEAGSGFEVFSDEGRRKEIEACTIDGTEFSGGDQGGIDRKICIRTYL